MNTRKWLSIVSCCLLSACALTPEQKAERVAAQKRAEQNLQINLAQQCDLATADLMRQQFQQTTFPNEQEYQNFRLRYVEKINDPMFQSCYKMAWQNYIAQRHLAPIERYHVWDDFYYGYRPYLLRRWH